MDWAAVASVLTVIGGTVAGSGWIALDRERSKLERDVAIYQQNLPAAARESIAQVIDSRASDILNRESGRDPRIGVYVLGVLASWYLALLAYVVWRIVNAFTALNVVCIVLAIAIPTFVYGLYFRHTEKRRASDARQALDRAAGSGEPPDGHATS